MTDSTESNGAPRPVRVFLVEDSPAILKNLTKSLAAHGDRVQVVGTAMSGEEAVEEIVREPPELVLLDLELPGIDGIQVTKRLKAAVPLVDVLILTSFDDERKVYEAIQAGAAGYLVKRVSVQKILDAIDEVRLGGTVLEPIIARRFWAYFDSIRSHGSSCPAADAADGIPDDSDGDVLASDGGGAPSEGESFSLTPVEREILAYIGKGLSNAEVGSLLSIDRRKVKTHLASIYQKMGVNTHVEAVVKALHAGLIHL